MESGSRPAGPVFVEHKRETGHCDPVHGVEKLVSRGRPWPRGQGFLAFMAGPAPRADETTRQAQQHPLASQPSGLDAHQRVFLFQRCWMPWQWRAATGLRAP